MPSARPTGSEGTVMQCASHPTYGWACGHCQSASSTASCGLAEIMNRMGEFADEIVRAASRTWHCSRRQHPGATRGRCLLAVIRTWQRRGPWRLRRRLRARSASTGRACRRARIPPGAWTSTLIEVEPGYSVEHGSGRWRTGRRWQLAYRQGYRNAGRPARAVGSSDQGARRGLTVGGPRARQHWRGRRLCEDC
jgi:hypothetical protein